jgi:hypothetical protein
LPASAKALSPTIVSECQNGSIPQSLASGAAAVADPMTKSDPAATIAVFMFIGAAISCPKYPLAPAL